MVQQRLKAFPQARKAITEALSIMDELGLQQDEYGSMLSVLGDLDYDQEHYEEALAIYDKAKAVLVHYKERHDYGVERHGCHMRLSQSNKAVAQQSC
jgi:hypothetical protein